MLTSFPSAGRRARAAAALLSIAALAAACGGPSSPVPASKRTPTVTVTATPAAQASSSGAPTAGGTPTGAPTASGAPAGADTFLATGQDPRGTALHQPACRSGCVLSGDSTSILYAMTWTTWTGMTAVGTGTENIESCVPDCASGGQYRVPVVVTFSLPVKDCAAAPGTATQAAGSVRWFWSRASFTYPRGLPKALRGANAPINPWRFASLIAQAQQSCT